MQYNNYLTVVLPSVEYSAPFYYETVTLVLVTVLQQMAIVHPPGSDHNCREVGVPRKICN